MLHIETRLFWENQDLKLQRTIKQKLFHKTQLTTNFLSYLLS